MENLFYNASQVLGVTIIHSMWQGLLIFFLLRLLFLCVPSLSSVKKHNLAIAAIFSITAWFICTLIIQINNYNWFIIQSAGQLPLQLSFPISAGHFKQLSTHYYYTIEGYLPYVSLLYFAGLLINVAKLGWEWKKVNRIKQGLLPAGLWQQYVNFSAAKLNISKYIQVSFSKLIDVPCVIGYIKPLILLPVSISTSLSADQIEAILLHELSHIKRNDYLLNLVQQIITILLFFNPFAQLINGIINRERENSCDDLVIKTTGKPLTYAHALVKLEETRHLNLQLALAVTGKKYHLLNRIERIMKTKKPIGNIRHILLALLLFAGSLCSIAWLNPTIADGRIMVKVVHPLMLRSLFTDTAKAVKKAAVNRKHKMAAERENDKELERLNATINKHADAISRFYDSQGFKRLNEEMEKKSKEMEAFSNNPELKKLAEQHERLSVEFEKKWNNNLEMERLNKQMEEMQKHLENYYNDPEFKQMGKKLAEVNNNLSKYKESSPEYKKQLNQLEELTKKMKSYSSSPEIKEQTEQIRKLSDQLRGYYDSEEFKKQRDELLRMSDSVRKAFNNPEIKEQQEAIRRLGNEMHNYSDNPELKREKKLLKEATSQLHNYLNSPAYRKKMMQQRKQVSSSINNDSLNHLKNIYYFSE